MTVKTLWALTIVGVISGGRPSIDERRWRRHDSGDELERGEQLRALADAVAQPLREELEKV